MITDISQLSPELLEQLKTMFVGKTDTSHRTGVRPVLHDLREPRNPANRLNRPSFFWSVEADEDAKPRPVVWYPKLKFRLTDEGTIAETVVMNETSEKALGSEWLDAPPVVQIVPTQDALRAELAELTDEDRALVIEAQRQARMDKLKAKLSTLSDADLSRVLGEQAPAKRGPGRPRTARGDGA